MSSSRTDGGVAFGGACRCLGGVLGIGSRYFGQCRWYATMDII